MRHVALLGGSFDPIHRGHLTMARTALEQLGADEVWFIPTYETPLKDRVLTSDSHRLAMIELAIQDEPRFRCDPIEVERAEKSYTIDTLRELTARYPDTRFTVLIGADQVAQFDRWRDHEQLLELANVVGVDAIFLR